MRLDGKTYFKHNMEHSKAYAYSRDKAHWTKILNNRYFKRDYFSQYMLYLITFKGQLEICFGNNLGVNQNDKSGFLEIYKIFFLEELIKKITLNNMYKFYKLCFHMKISIFKHRLSNILNYQR